MRSFSNNPGLHLRTWFRFWTGKNLAPFVPTPMPIVRDMFKVAQVTRRDQIYDLGCGDGRIPITAARQFGSTGVGVEMDKRIADLAKENVKIEGVEDLVTILQQDALKTDLTHATLVCLYLSEPGNHNLKPLLLNQLSKGSRIVSFHFPIEGMEPDHVVETHGRTQLHLFNVK
eukprot:gb/GECH01006226.1/.p1 GENE.gb/GECH01006226.1/~~gb/GECH01006226.1/.p1  ORF type:complete len:173 (+),score=40.02 gb/GECH01006226.1/:1-519(+)